MLLYYVSDLMQNINYIQDLALSFRNSIFTNKLKIVQGGRQDKRV